MHIAFNNIYRTNFTGSNSEVKVPNNPIQNEGNTALEVNNNNVIKGVSAENIMAYHTPIAIESTVQEVIATNKTPITRDRFTKLRDKTCLLGRLEEKKAEAEASGKKLQVAMMDMDNFKSVNEILGYETGDIFIKRVAEIIKKHAEAARLGSYRFGGEEFVIVNISNSPDKLKDVCQKIRDEISEDPALTSYNDTYKNTLQCKLTAYDEVNSIIQSINEMAIELDLLDSIQTKNHDLKRNKIFQEDYHSISRTMTIYMGAMLSYAVEHAGSKTEEDGLTPVLYKIKHGTKEEQKEVINNKKLREYLDDKFNKQLEVSQIKKWLKDFESNGFGITCGIANMGSEYFDGVPALDLVNTAGEVLKDGKATKKGGVYIQDFPTRTKED